MNKDLIKKRFARNLGSYNDNARIQKQMAEKLVSFLKEKEYNNILEIGCGTGLLTELAVENLKFEKYVANDIVEGCSEYVKNICPEIKFVSGDIEELLEQSDAKYDLIISNAVFQWFDDLSDVINKLVQKLNKGGTLLFSTFGAENYREIFFVLGKTLPYFSKREIEEMIKAYAYEIEEESRILAFNTPKDILKHIKLTGVNALEPTTWTKSDMIKFENGYNNFCSGVPTLTYHPIYVNIHNK